ncbi:MAG: AMP-binding protein, partial [Candidatus Omnitrophica bacterium]|nr:AMP-binding protein [Candidatus Omnitrophota bacterium]
MLEDNFVIHGIFSNAVSNNPDRVALQTKRDNSWQRFTYKEVETLSLKLATYLIKQGCKKGDFAALILENCPEWPIIYFGIIYAGLGCVPLDPQLSGKEIENFLNDSGSKVIFSSHGIFTKKIGKNIGKKLNRVIILDSPDDLSGNLIKFSEIENVAPDLSILPTVSPADTASLVYTSGTTAQSKGVLLTHKNICSNFHGIQERKVFFASDNSIAILPLYHTYAFMATLIAPLLLGGKITYFPLSYKPSDLSSVIKEAEVTVLTAVPQLLFLLYKGIAEKTKKIPPLLMPLFLPLIRNKVRKQFGKSLRLLVSGGARIEPKVAEALSRLMGVKLIEGYGLTETSPIVTLNPPERQKFGSVGKPIPGVKIKIVDPDESGIGEVAIQGPNVMAGYFKRPDLTSEVIKDDWFYSGDLGYIDRDGYLFLSARKKDVIVLSSGKNIYPGELEEHYIKSPYIKEICIMPKTEERFGRLIDSLYAVVVPDFEYLRKRNEANIQARVRWDLENLGKDLPSYKHIMGFVITKEELPRTSLKKIKRYQVSKKFADFESVKEEAKEEILSEEDTNILSQDIAKKIIGYLNNELKKPIHLNSHLEIDLGIDSLSKVELILGLEALFSIKIPEETLGKAATVKELIVRVLEIIEEGATSKETREEAAKTWSEILREQPEEKTLEKISLVPRFLDTVILWIIIKAFFCIFKVFWLLRVKGKELLPSKGPYLICPNHASYLDGAVLISSLPFKYVVNIFSLGYSDIFEKPVFRWSIKLAHLIPIDPNTNLTEAMQAIAHVIRHGKMACIFPAGRRSIDENVQEFKKGVGILIKELDIPVVPAYIKNSH